jgi:hypothetical protein
MEDEKQIATFGIRTDQKGSQISEQEWQMYLRMPGPKTAEGRTKLQQQYAAGYKGYENPGAYAEFHEKAQVEGKKSMPEWIADWVQTIRSSHSMRATTKP